jgi:hypothetical protein
MSEDRQNRAPRHPRLDRRSLVLWTAGGGAVGDVGCEERDAVGAIALPLRRVGVAADTPAGGARSASGASAGGERGGAAASGGATGGGAAAQLARARVGGLGIALPGQAWLNQLAPDARPAGFDALPYAQPAPLSLDRARLTATALADYAEAYLDAQLAAGATLVTTPAHVLADELGTGRQQELALAAAAVRCWNERQGWRPPPQFPDTGPRELHAALAVRPDRLPGSTAELIAAYAALPVDGYWLTLVDGHVLPTARPSGALAAGARGDDLWAQAAAVAELALGLQEASGRPVTVAGAGHLHAALLASGVAATCTGAEVARPVFPPRALDADGVTGIAAPVFHPAILGHLPAGAGSAEARTALFATEPCRCGAHVAFEPPAGRRETLAHNRWCLVAETREATRLVPPLDEARLAARAARAAKVRRRLGLPPLSPAWAAVAETAQTRRARRAAAPA